MVHIKVNTFYTCVVYPLVSYYKLIARASSNFSWFVSMEFVRLMYVLKNAMLYKSTIVLHKSEPIVQLCSMYACILL